MTSVRGPRAVTRSLAGPVLRTARPKQWTKNLLVGAAPAAAGVLTHVTPFLRTAGALALFAGASSGVYFLNDAIDVQADRVHPRKRLRPMAAGTLPVGVGVAIGVLLLGAAAGLSVLLSWQLSLIVVIYLVLQMAYALRLKHMPVYDLACVAGGFVLRAIAGGVAARVPVSEWFLLVATFGSLLMVRASGWPSSTNWEPRPAGIAPP